MKHFIQFLLCSLLLFITGSVHAMKWERPDVIYSNFENLKVEKVVFSETATSVEFRLEAAANTKIRMRSSLYASDEQGLRYPVLNTEGIRLDSLMQITEGKPIAFTVHFAPMPVKTKVFDVIEGKQLHHFRIIGIHEHGKALKLKKPKDAIDQAEIADHWFIPSTAVICGRIHDYDEESMPHEVTVCYNCKQFHAKNEIVEANSATIQPDGTFSCSFLMDRPAWNNLAIGPQDYYYYYIRPGDTLQLDIENFGKWNEKVSYANKQGRPCYETLVTKGEVIYGEGEFLRSRDASCEEFQRFLDTCGRQAEQLQAYLAWKYQLTPWEVHLLRTQQILELASLQVVFMNKKFGKRPDGIYSGEEYLKIMNEKAIPKEYQNWFNRISWNDTSLALSQLWNSNNITILLENLDKDLSTYSLSPIVRKDLEERDWREKR